MPERGLTVDEIERLLDRYHRLKQEAQDETTDRFELGKVEAFGIVIQDLETLDHGE